MLVYGIAHWASKREKAREKELKWKIELESESEMKVEFENVESIENGDVETKRDKK